MAMDVSGLSSSHASGTRGKVTGTPNDARQPTASGASVAQGSSAETVKLSSQAQSLQRMEQEIAQLPDTDDDRIEQLRNAIADGSYQIDPQRVAAKLLQFEDQL